MKTVHLIVLPHSVLNNGLCIKGTPPHSRVISAHLYSSFGCQRYIVVCKITHKSDATTMGSKELIKLIEAHGWHLVATRGSHRQYKHPTLPGRVTIPHPNKDLPRGTVQSILKQAGLK